MNFFKKLFVYFLIFLNFSLLTQESKVTQIKVGNFALPPSQQPGPLISFGQNIIDEKDLQFFMFVDDISGKNQEFVRVVPTFLYGIRDNFSFYSELSIAAKFQQNDVTSRGVQYLLGQLEYAVYDKVLEESTAQITTVLNMTFPMSPNCQVPPYIGFGSPTFFVGFTASRVSPSWYYFISSGATVTTDYEKTKFGNQYLYEAGLSRNIAGSADKFICNLTLELNGMYAECDTITGVVNQNSGGNTITLGPSIWVSTSHWIFQCGIAWYVYQNLFGVQNKNDYYVAMSIGYKF